MYTELESAVAYHAGTFRDVGAHKGASFYVQAPAAPASFRRADTSRSISPAPVLFHQVRLSGLSELNAESEMSRGWTPLLVNTFF